MSGRDDKLGPYILYGDEFNRYDVFAASEDNFATLDEANPSTNDQGAFELYKHRTNADERRVLVHADHVYGERRPVERLIFDIAHSASAWVKGATAASNNGQVQEQFDSDLTLKVRSITKDFDPSSVTWNSAYTGGGALAFGATAEITLAMLDGTLTVDEAGPNGMASAEVEAAVEFPALLAIKREDLANWNAESAVYGWELAISTDGAGLSASWTGSPSSSLSACFAILK